MPPVSRESTGRHEYATILDLWYSSPGRAWLSGVKFEVTSIRIHAITHNSTVNGPGRRTVIHTQGCTLRCRGCFNPLAQPPTGGTPYSIEQLMDIIRHESPDGVSLSGGEPTDQLAPVVELCRRLHDEGFSILMFSGRTLEEIRRLPGGETLLKSLDVLIDGPYDDTRPATHGLCGSSNQQIHLLSPRHTQDELALRETEIIIEANGEIRISGFPDADLTRGLRKELQG